MFSCLLPPSCLLPTCQTGRVELQAATGVRVCGDEEKVAAHGKGRDVGGQLVVGVAKRGDEKKKRERIAEKTGREGKSRLDTLLTNLTETVDY